MKTYINCFISLKYQINGGLFSGAKLKVPIDKGAKWNRHHVIYSSLQKVGTEYCGNYHTAGLYPTVQNCKLPCKIFALYTLYLIWASFSITSTRNRWFTSLVLTITITNVLCGIQTSELQTIPGSFQPYPFLNRTARHCNENSRRIFPEMKLRGLVSSSYIHVSHSDLYIPMIGPPILLFVGRSWENINPCPNWRLPKSPTTPFPCPVISESSTYEFNCKTLLLPPLIINYFLLTLSCPCISYLLLKLTYLSGPIKA